MGTMLQELRDIQASAGAAFAPLSDSDDTQIPLSFGNDEDALAAARSQVALYDRSHWGRIQVSGGDRLRYLHNQSTNDFNALKPGQGCDTVFVTSTARTIDLATALALEEAVLLLVSPNRRQYLMSWMDRFIFFSDQVKLQDITPATACFSLIGPASHSVLNLLGVESLADQPRGTHTGFAVNGVAGRIMVGSGVAIAGYTLFVDATDAAMLWKALIAADVVPLGEQTWQQLRVEQGRPAPDAELTEDINPLEAGLWHTISFSKGCYIGQETIARLNTYKGVKQQLWGIRLSAPVAVETPILLADDKVGKLTSCIQHDQTFLGLAYIRSKVAAAGLQVNVGDSKGELVALPFISHEYVI